MDPDTGRSDTGSTEMDDSGTGPAWQRLDDALGALETALMDQKRQAEDKLQALHQDLEAARAENARLEELLKAERARVQRLEDLTSAVSGRVDSAIGELESILEP